MRRFALAALPRSGHGGERLAVAAWVATVAVCFVASIYIISIVRFSGEDSWFPIGRALDLLHGPRSGQLYQTLFFSERIKFQYPPASLLLPDLLRSLDVSTASAYNAINGALMLVYAATLALFARRVLGRIWLLGVQLPVAPIAFLIALAFYPDYLALRLGQVQILLDFLFLLASLARLSDAKFIAGCLIGAAATVKPQFLPLVLLTLWWREWTFAAGAAIIAIPAVLLSVLLYGIDAQFDYLTVLSFLTQHGELYHLNQSVNGIVGRFLYLGPSLDIDPQGPIRQSAFPPYIPVVYFATLVTSLLLTALPFVLNPRTDDRLARLLLFSAAAILFTMATPIAWVHHYGILLPGYVVAIQAIRSRKAKGRGAIEFVVLATSFVLTGLPLAHPFAPTVRALNLLQSHVFIGACLLIGLLLAEWRSRAGNTLSPAG
jgi:hypothetical protein